MTSTHANDDARTGTGQNGINPALARGFVNRIERLFGDLDSERGQYMQRCRTIRDSIKNMYEDAKLEGIPKRELKTVIKTRALERKADALRADLEPEERETVDQIKAALGPLADTPLGGAALAAAH